MKKRAIVILADGFEEIEAVTVIDILRRSEIQVSICGLDVNLVRGSREITISADKILEKSDLESKYDACVLPGGMPGAENLASSDMVKELLIRMHGEEKIIAAICASPALVLSPIGILDDKDATCFPNMRGDFSSRTTYKEDNVVIDGNIITSRGPATAMEFTLSIVGILCGRDIASKVRKALLA